jgi:CRP/FNR family transcriptional regulator
MSTTEKDAGSLAERLALLRQVSFLSELDGVTLGKLAARVTRRRVGRGEPICQDDQPCAGVWVVVEGSIQSVKVSPGGRLQILDTAGATGTCSLASALDGGCCPMRTEARVDSTVLLIPREALHEAVEQEPRLALAIARHLGSRLRGVTCQLVSLGLRDVRARVAALLVEESVRGVQGPDGSVKLRLPASQAELAHRIGTEREVFARALKGLKDEGLIEQERGRVSIRDLAALRRVVTEC